MSIFAISDLHLSFGTNKPMNIFKGWDNHTERIKANWTRLVKPEDTVVLPGDLSWALKTEEALEDFKFLESLPGQKILLKGNHDLWWSTAKKLNEFFAQNNISSVKLVYNNCAVVGEYAVCGTRGWFYDNSGSKKVLLREAGRLDTSIKAAKETGLEPIVFLHYPPVYGEYVCEEMLEILKNHGISTVYHGHIHGSGFHNAISEYDGINFKLISCDCIDFTPFFITL